MLAESLFFSAVLFTIGVVGVLTRRNAIIAPGSERSGFFLFLER